MAGQMLLVVSTTRVSNPHFLTYMASYDVASSICQALVY